MTPQQLDPTTPVVVRRNDYDVCRARFEDDARPSRTVSVVIPAYGDQAKLDLTLAALAAQNYPAELMEVVVADDGSEPALRLPSTRPERTSIVRTPEGSWGIAGAVETAVAASTGEVVLRLDSDVVPAREHVKSHLRWHHLGDHFVVLGRLVFVDAGAEHFHPLKVRDAVAAGELRELFGEFGYEDEWQIGLIRESEGRIDDEIRAFITANGATISFTREMHDAAGGLDRSMPLGSDTEFGYRMAQQGAVFVPEETAEVWHLGLSQMKSERKQAGTRFRHQYMANRVPSLRYLRNRPGLRWRVPYVEVVVDVSQASLEPVRSTLTSVLGGSLQDVAVVLTGPWSDLSAERVSPLDDPQLELRLIREAFGGASSVEFRKDVARTPESAPFRLTLRAGAVLEFDGLRALVEHTDAERLGLLELTDADGEVVAAVQRTAAVNRAIRLGLGDSASAIDRVWGTASESAAAWLRSSRGAEGSLLRRRRMLELRREIDRLRAIDRRAGRGSSPLRRLAGRVKRGLLRRIRRSSTN